MPSRSVLAVLLLSLAVSAAGAEKRVATGTWGGNQVRMTVSDDGAEVEYGCVSGRIRSPLRLDAEGRFDVKGTSIQQQPGPEREVPESAEPTARYKGQVKGDTMTLSVSLPDARQSVGPFTLTRGRNVVLRRCQ